MRNGSDFPPPPPAPPGSEPVVGEILSPGMFLPAGRIVSDAFGMYFRNFLSYSGIVFVVYLPLILWTIYLHLEVESLMGNEGVSESLFMHESGLQRIILITLVTFGLSLLFQPVATGAIIFAVFRAKKGERAGFGRALGVAFGRLLQLIGVAVASALILIVCAGLPAILAALFLGGGGFGILLGLPLFVGCLVIFFRLLCGLYVASPVAVVERAGVGESISRSFSLSRGSRWRIFGVIFSVGVVQFIVNKIVEVVALDGQGLGLVLELCSMIAFAAIAAVASASCYYYLKVREGADVDELASVFD